MASCLRLVPRVPTVRSIMQNEKIHRDFSAQKDSAKGIFASQYCVNLVQQYDRENFLCTLLLKGKQRRHVFAVRAFNVELAKIGSSISEDTIGKMRLQFWHEAVDKCFSIEKGDNTYVKDHPVLKELKNTIDENKITKQYLKRLITARDRPPNKPFLTMKEMEDYAEQSTSSLYYVLLEIGNVRDVNVDHAISHLGKAQGILNLLRAIPLQGRKVAVNIPQEILMKNGVSQERIIRDISDDKGVEECVFDVATASHQHLQKARNLSKHVPSTVKPLFLPAVAIDRYLDRLRETKFRLSDKRLLERDHLLPLAFFWSKLLSKY